MRRNSSADKYSIEGATFSSSGGVATRRFDGVVKNTNVSNRNIHENICAMKYLKKRLNQ